MKKIITRLSFFILLTIFSTSCEDEKPEIPEKPCIGISKNNVATGEKIIFEVCSEADMFTLWPGDEGHAYEKYGQDKGFSFKADSISYIYKKPGTYHAVIVAVNQNNGYIETSLTEFEIEVTESIASFEYFAYEEVFPPITGEFEGDSIFLTVPFKTDLTDMVMTFEAGFAEVRVNDSIQESGVTSNDFSSPVSYEITSWNGEKNNEFIVKVDKVPPKSENELFDFGFSNLDDSTYINHEDKTINVTVPFGAAINNLIAEFSVSESATVKVNGTIQESGKTPNNFLKAVQYSIIAEDGSTKTYDVIIQERPSPRNNFLYFAFTEPQAVGEIDNENREITITVPEDTDLSSMQPIISTSKESSVYIGGEEQVSGESVVNFTNTVYYVVKAENGDIALYTVTVIYT
jgi:hypothetical protein